MFGKKALPIDDAPPSAVDACMAFLDEWHLVMDVVVVTILIAALHRNYVHRFVTIATGCYLFTLAGPVPPYAWVLLAVVAHAQPAWLNRRYHKKQPETGAVFVTGADSGMGEATVLELCRNSGYERVYAGCFSKASGPKLRAALGAPPPAEGIMGYFSGDEGDEVPAAAAKCVPVPLDVCDDASVAAAAEFVKADLAKGGCAGLVAVVQCAGMGYNGPGEFIPIDIYKKQMDVNFFGYVRVTQALMPLVRAGCEAAGRRGRMVYTGTGGGVLTPVPPLLTAYMASKFAVEAFVRSFRVEMQLTGKPVDATVISPGFVKPTMLVENGLKLNEQMWAACEKRLGTGQARDEYGPLLDRFIEYSLAEKGTHVSEVARRIKLALAAGRPLHGYKVGPDSRATPIAGLLPIPVADAIMKFTVFGRQGSF
mmetsp:Transcript_22897/g.68736  ORF Transcript_22897/g.68736 Transcript_22897/m.68736 type:complete len:424 (-) Transcript_22897:69-1340(-)